MSDVEARNDDRAWEVTVEYQPVHPGSDDRDTHRDAGECGAKTGAGEQVVGEGVSEEALEHCQDEKQATDDPVGLTWAPERTGEEDAHHVNDDRRREHQCGPVVDLPHEQTTANLEGNIECGGVGARHRHTAERLVDAVVLDLAERWVEEQGQEHARDQQDDEAVQRDFAEQEGPVRREDLVDLPTKARCEVIAAVDTIGLLGREGTTLRRTIWPTLYYVLMTGLIALFAAYVMGVRDPLMAG